jgi:hypothetical protein
MPGVRQALNDDDPTLFDEQLTALVGRIRAATLSLKSVVAEPAPVQVPVPAPGASR